MLCETGYRHYTLQSLNLHLDIVLGAREAAQWAC